MKVAQECLSICGQGRCGGEKVPNWFLVLGRESYGLGNKAGGTR